MQQALPAVYALFVWWFTTGIALYIVGLPRTAHRWAIIGAVALFAGSLYGLAIAARDPGVVGAFAAFTFAILLWGAIEISFLTGIVTGPMRSVCPPGCERWLRAVYAIGAILWHELLLLVAGTAIVVVSWGAQNQLGVWTFVLLWVMRLSTKLNLFLGVPVTNDELLPAPVSHLKSYFTKGPLTAFFPVSVTLATVLTILLVEGSFLTDVVRPEGLMLLATLSALAVLEHWFMALPGPVEALWAWSLPRRLATVRDATEPTPVVTIVHAIEGARTQTAFEAWTAPVIDIRDASERNPATSNNVHPHPALSKHRRRP